MASSAPVLTLVQKIYIIPLSNHLYMHWCLMASCDRKHVIAMYMPKLISPSNATYEPHMAISSCAYVTTMSVYMPGMDPLQ